MKLQWLHIVAIPSLNPIGIKLEVLIFMEGGKPDIMPGDDT
jgi:hypothetical protein